MTDIPLLDETISQLPTDYLNDIAEVGKTDLFFLGKAVLGMKDMTEDCHGPFCTFLAQNPAQFKMALMPRDHLKTSCGTIAGTLQLGIRDPESQNLIANESATNSERMLGVIKTICESSRIFRTLYSDLIPKNYRSVSNWSSQALQLVRQGTPASPTFDTIGMTGAVTSRHYTHMTFDDPISEEAVKSDKVMKDTISRMGAIMALLTDPSKNTIWFIGTRWALSDVYSHQMRVRKRMAKFIRAAIEDGKPIWPERFPMHILAEMRDDMEEYKFSCLMMNQPRDEAIQDFNIRDLRFWAWNGTDKTHVVLYDVNGVEKRRLPLSALDISTTVDLAPAERVTSDRNAVVTTGVTPYGEAVVLDAWGSRCTPLELIEKIFQVNNEFHPRTFGIEGVAYQKALKYFLREEANRRGVYLNIRELPAIGKKERRIRGLQPVAATGRLFIEATQHILRNEMSEFPLGMHDDVLDALSMQLQLWRGVLSPEQIETSRKHRERLMANIDGYGLKIDPGVLVLPNGAIVHKRGQEFDPEELEDELERRRYINWEEARIA